MKVWQWITHVGLVMVLGACTIPQPNQNTLELQADYWQQVGGRVATGSNANASLAQTSDGIPVIAYSASDGTFNNISVKRWTGSSWVQLGGFLDVNTKGNANDPSLALDSSGNPVVAWEEDIGPSFNIYVKR